MTPDQHLAHLKRLIQAPYTNGWWAYAKARAEELALEDSANAALPTLLHAERERIKAEAESSRTPSKSASRPKPGAQSKNVSRETKGVHIPSEMRKNSTGQPALS
jgi:ATPase subunit of ABC transporter with duplicated ATPase domains